MLVEIGSDFFETALDQVYQLSSPKMHWPSGAAFHRNKWLASTRRSQCTPLLEATQSSFG